MKKFIALLLTALLVIALVGGCGSTNSAQDEQPEEQVEEINISYVKLPLNVPSIIEKNKNLFEEEFSEDNITINYPEITQGPKMTEAIAGGSLDFCNALGGTSAILAAANGVDLKIIGIYSRAPKAFTIMVNDSSIKTIADLKGKTIVGPKGTILHQLLLGALAQEDLQVEDVKFTHMGIPQGVAALMSGNADAALVAGPAVTKAVEGGAQIITTGEGILDATIVIGVRGEFLREHPELVKRYMKVHNNSLKYMAENPEDTFKLAAEETNIALDEVKTMYQWYNFAPTITEKDIEELEKTQDFLLENEMLTKKIDIKSIIADV